MISNKEYISRFMTRSYEKSIDFYMLADKKYVIPRFKVNEYIDRILSIPYSEYIDYIRDNQGIIDDAQLTQSSNFTSCSSEMCEALESKGNPGLSFIEIGQMFPNYITKKNEAAFRKYGENQIKTSTQLGLTFEYYDRWYLTCIGYVYNQLNHQKQEALFARTVLRIPLYQDIMLRLLKGDVYLTDYMKQLAPSTQGRRAGSIIRLLDFCLHECKRNHIRYHDLYYPIYMSKNKMIRIAKSPGTSLRVFDSYQVGCIPLYSLKAACSYFESGGITEAEGWVDATGLGFSPDPKCHFVIHAKGDSMLPLIKDGDYCVFEWSEGNLFNGTIALVQRFDVDKDNEGSYTIKRYYSEKGSGDNCLKNGKIELRPINTRYDIIVLNSIESYKIIGIFKCVL